MGLTVTTTTSTANHIYKSRVLASDYLILGFGPAGCITLIELLKALAEGGGSGPVSITVVDPNFEESRNRLGFWTPKLRTHGGAGFSDPVDTTVRHLLLVNGENLETIPYPDERLLSAKQRIPRTEVRELLNQQLSEVLSKIRKSNLQLEIRLIRGIAIGAKGVETNGSQSAESANNQELFIEVDSEIGALRVAGKHTFLALGNVPKPPMFPSLPNPYPVGFFETAYSIDGQVVKQILSKTGFQPHAVIIGTGEAAVEAFLLLEHYSDSLLTYFVYGPPRLTPFDLPSSYHWSQVEPVAESLNLDDAAIDKLNKFIHSFGQHKFSLIPKVSFKLPLNVRDKFNKYWLNLARRELCHPEFVIFRAKLEGRITFHTERVFDVRVSGNDTLSGFEVMCKSKTITSPLVVFCGGYSENGLLKHEAFHSEPSVHWSHPNFTPTRCKYWFDVVHPVIADLLELGLLDLDDLELAIEGIASTPQLVKSEHHGSTRLHVIGSLTGSNEEWSLRNFRYKIQNCLRQLFVSE